MKSNFNESVDRFLTYITHNRGRSSSTASAYYYDLNRFKSFAERKGVLTPNQIRINDLEEYLAIMANTNSPVTVARVRSSLRSFFKYLTSKGLIESDPANHLESIKLPHKEAPYLSDVQYQRFLAAVAKATPYFRERDTALMNLLIKSGLRRSEAARLNINDLDIESRQLKVKRKGNKEQIIPLHPELANDLAHYLKTINRTGDKPLFISKKHGRLTPSGIWRLVKHYSRIAGLDSSITTHSLRHSFCTNLLVQGMPVYLVASLMGHSQVSTTMHYAHFNNGQLTKSLQVIKF